MKTKFLLLLFAIFSIISCSKDDDAPYVIPAEKRYLSYVTNKDGKTTLKIEYDENKRFKKFILDDQFQIRYVYDDKGRVTSVFTNGAENSYNYDANGRISSHSFNGKNYPVIYNAAENSYTYDVSENVNKKTKIFLDAAGNCNKIISNNTDVSFFYENNKIGPLKNGGNMNFTNYIGFSPMALTLQYSVNLFAVPLEDLNSATFAISYINEYDSENFLIRSKVIGTEPNEYTYHYIEL